MPRIPNRRPSRIPNRRPSKRPSRPVILAKPQKVTNHASIPLLEPVDVDRVPDTTKPFALLVGIEYTRYARQNKIDRLPGCHRDMSIMRVLLHEKYGIPFANMRIYMDDGKHPEPDIAKIREGLQWLKNTGSDNLWFVYSGHGSNVANQQISSNSNDESDGRDEVLVPSDFYTGGFLKDDELRSFALSLPQDSNFVTMFDCCHSGSIVDLPYYWSSKNTNVQSIEGNQKWPTNGANVISLSACADKQTSVSAFNLDNRRNWQGALTFAFDTVSRRGYNDGLDLINGISRIISSKGFDQITVLSTSKSHASPQEIQFPLVK